mgnify:FL=1
MSASTQHDLERTNELLTQAVERSNAILREYDDASQTHQRRLTPADEERYQHTAQVAETALNALALLLLQEGHEQRLESLLKSAGYRYRLADAIIRYALPESAESVSLTAKEQQALLRTSGRYVRAIDNALPAAVHESLRRWLGAHTSFWREHHYSVIPPSAYLSYLHELHPSSSSNNDSNDEDAARAPPSGFEEVIAFVHSTVVKLFPKAAEARYAEWWAHCRPHSSGHQLHFDSDDEGRGGVRNPIVSSVIFLDARVGGPTLVTNQPFGSRKLADHGWLVSPSENRLVVFDGSMLHGVIPGRGLSPLIQHQAPAGTDDGKRLTLMIAFWKDAVWRPSASEEPGANRVFPSASSTRYSWHRAMLAPLPDDVRQQMREHPEPIAVLPRAVAPVWQDVDAHENARNLCSAASLRFLPEYSVCWQGF